MIKFFKVYCLFVVFNFTLTGCVSMNTISMPLKKENKVAVMPLVDIREGGETVKGDKFIDYNFMRHFLLRGYEVDMIKEFNSTSTPKQIANMDADELAKLGPKDSKYKLYVVLNNIDKTYAGLFTTTEVSLTGILIQSNPAKVIFKQNVTDTTTTTIIGTTLDPIIARLFLNEKAITNALDVLLENLKNIEI